MFFYKVPGHRLCIFYKNHINFTFKIHIYLYSVTNKKSNYVSDLL